jgi:flavin reductase (DIM6/NTAB) family NADH-FMN oxidoreductase RutF
VSGSVLRDNPYLTRAVIEAPVGLVITRGDGGANAMTASLFSEVAHYPTTMWIAVAPTRSTHATLTSTGRFTFVTLHARQAEIAVACGTRSGRDHDKCRDLALYEGGDGFLFLRDALASTACVIERSLPVGDHTLFIARLLSGALEGRRTAQRHLLLSDLRVR